MDFSETIAVNDMKVGRSRHLNEYMKVSIEGQGHYLTLAHKVVNIQKFKMDFLRNCCADLNHVLYESFQVQGNENLMT